MKIAFVIGHYERDKGAYSKFLEVSEYDFYGMVVPFLSGVDVYRHDPKIGGYKTRIKNTANKLNKQDYDLIIEGHFNSVEDETANGCETLYYFNSKKGRKYAELFSQMVVDCTGIKKRGDNGCKALVNKNDRGFASVYYTKAPTIMIEPFFGSNKNDCELIKGAQYCASIIQDFIERVNEESK